VRAADEMVMLAARNCPATAITIIDADSGRRLFPEEEH